MIRGDENKFPTRIRMPDGTVYRGNKDSFPAEIRMPDGTVYRGRTVEQKARDDAKGAQ